MYAEVQGYGESFRLGFEPEELATLLRDVGFRVIKDIPAPELKEMYFTGRCAARLVTPIFRFVHAREAFGR